MKPTIHDKFPSYAEATGVKWLLNEIIDHLWPWTQQGWHHHKAIQTAGLALAIAATTAWGLAANGQLGAGALIGWWLGWSVYEIIIRLQCKPYIKDGPWWRHCYRPAGRMDMICYVMFKNLLIGAVLFVLLRNIGLLQMGD
jgi:NosR/NirI family transcriptional regulator, nitrous oxide reductase regulator